MHGNCWEGFSKWPLFIGGVQIPRDFPQNRKYGLKKRDYYIFGIINILSNHSPDKIVLGGGVMSQSHLYKMIRSNIDKLWNSYTPLGSLSELVVEPALGKESGIIGSLSLV